MATIEIELFACERYRPMSGWSSDYLLPTDQHAYRVRGRKGGWTKLQDAEEALLAPGWAWEVLQGPDFGGQLGWEVDTAGLPADSDGWSYGTNFTSTYEGAAKGGMKMFARWRRLVRTQTFSGIEQLQQALSQQGAAQIPCHGCMNVDMTYAEEVGRHLHEGLAAASLYSDWSLPVFVKLKAQLVEILAGLKGADKFNSLEGALTDFVGAQKPITMRLAEVFKGAGDVEVDARMLQVEKWFPQAERDALATMSIWRFQPDQACDAGCAAHECSFQAVICGNCGCSERLSVRRVPAHDAVCSFKKVSCDKCGEEIPRGELRGHASAACPMREAVCNYSVVGCGSALTHNQVARHLEDCSQAHMLLLLQTVVDQQATIGSLFARVEELEANRKDLEAERNNQEARLIARVTDLESKLTALDKRNAQDSAKCLRDATTAADKKANSVGSDARRHADSAVASVRSELAAVRSEMNSVKASVNGLEKKVEPIIRDRQRS